MNAVDTHQLTPLMLAAKAAHVDSVQVCLGGEGGDREYVCLCVREAESVCDGAREREREREREKERERESE